MATDEKFWRVAELAALWQVSVKQVYRWLLAGEIESHMFGKCRRVSDQHRLDFEDRHKTVCGVLPLRKGRMN